MLCCPGHISPQETGVSEDQVSITRHPTGSSDLDLTCGIETSCEYKASKNTRGSKPHPPLEIVAAMPFDCLCFYTRETFSRLLACLPPTSRLRETPSKRAQCEWSNVVSCHLGIADQLQSLPPGIDLSSMINPGSRPECPVEAVEHFRPFLQDGWMWVFWTGGPEDCGAISVRCRWFADLWMGERTDGAIVAIKSLRYYSFSSCLPTYLVSSNECNPDIFRLAKHYPQRLYEEASEKGVLVRVRR